MLLFLLVQTIVIDGIPCRRTAPGTYSCTIPVDQFTYPGVDAVARKIGNADAIALCGLRRSPWYTNTTYRLERRLDALYARLPAGERSSALAYARRTARAQRDWTLGGKGLAGCRDLATMPSVYRDEAFYP